MWYLAAAVALVQPAEWQDKESPYLKNIRQVTQGFVRAGARAPRRARHRQVHVEA